MTLSKWDLRFLKIAREVSSWSKDPNRKVGAVIVKNRRVLSTGYNGFPVNFPDEDREDKNLFTVHAEANAITKVAKSGNSSKGATLYVTASPCLECAKLIIQAGITRVVYKDEYRLTDGVDLLRKAGIEVEKKFLVPVVTPFSDEQKIN